MPYVEAYFDDEIDYNRILSDVEQSVKVDPIVENIFLGMSLELKRREIIAEFKISVKDYNNGVRRLKTILNCCAGKYDLKD